MEQMVFFKLENMLTSSVACKMLLFERRDLNAFKIMCDFVAIGGTSEQPVVRISILNIFNFLCFKLEICI